MTQDPKGPLGPNRHPGTTPDPQRPDGVGSYQMVPPRVLMPMRHALIGGAVALVAIMAILAMGGDDTDTAEVLSPTESLAVSEDPAPAQAAVGGTATAPAQSADREASEPPAQAAESDAGDPDGIFDTLAVTPEDEASTATQ